ncbi:acyl-CoA N-acyltransferase [Sporodiniella umbellata]|nr:acyl-CoA N-acyltransferase [Sporodiniella umbellata]
MKRAASTQRPLNHPEPKTTTKKVRLRLTVTDDEDPKRKRGLVVLNEQDELYYKTFGHKLSLTDADIQRGTPGEPDKQSFEKAREMAEEIANPEGAEMMGGIDVPKIRQISFGNYLIDTWYIAPYPEEYSQSRILYICEFCMKYMKSQFVAQRHRKKCTAQHPPGDEIYRDRAVSIYEVDGRKNKIYCQNLCLMAKMFLDHKTLYYDVEPFLFYIMTEVDERGSHFVGYFSKEKRSAMNYNVSCILTMPIYQRKGYGQFLIDFSYVLSMKESKVGTPERPLSELGLLSYRSYWKTKVFRELQNNPGPISIEQISHHTGLTPDDIISTLESHHMLIHCPITQSYSLSLPPQLIDAHLTRVDQKHQLQVDQNKLTWTPFVLSKDRLAILLGENPKLTVKNSDEAMDVDID